MPDPISLDLRLSSIRPQLWRGRIVATAVLVLLSASAVACGSSVDPLPLRVDPPPTAERYAYTEFPVEGTVDRIRVEAIRRMMTSTVVQNGASVTQTWRWSGNAWIKDAMLAERLRTWCMSRTGLVAGISTTTLWISSVPGAWQAQALPASVASATAITSVGCADSAVLIATITPSPQVFRLESTGWVDLQYPSQQPDPGQPVEGLSLFPVPSGEIYTVYRTLGYAFRPGPVTVRRFSNGTWQAPATDQLSGQVVPVGDVVGMTDGYLYAATYVDNDPAVYVVRFGADSATVDPVKGFDSRALSPFVGPGGWYWGVEKTGIAWPTSTGSDYHALRDGRTTTGAGWVGPDTTLWIGTSTALLAVRRNN